MTELTLPVDIKNAAGERIARLEEGAAEGTQYPTLRLYKGDIINVRNVQGGTVDNPNLDLGAGDSGDNRGTIVCNWDVGNGFQVYDGRKSKIMSMNVRNDRRIHSHVPHRFAQGAFIPDGKGGWKRLT